MHMTITVLVYAENPEDARSKAEYLLPQLDHFDYFNILGEPIKTSSTRGKQIVDRALDWTKSAFTRHLTKIRNTLKKHTNRQLWEAEHAGPNMFRWHCYHAGEYTGTDTWLYDNDGEGIRDPQHLQNVLEKWPTIASEKYKYDDVWAVCADVHH